MKRETLQHLLHFCLKYLTRLEFVGLEHIPREGGLIVVTNHLSRVDIPVLFMTPPRPEITALVADKYKDYFLMRWMVETAGAIWIDRSKADFAAFREALDVIKQGKAMGISPEGTRSETGQLLEAKAGAVLLAQKARVPIVPVGISGSEQTFPKLARLQRAHIVARFGPMFTLPPLERDNREEQMKQQTDEIMCRIAALLPESYRGFYADHPRLKELLDEQSGLAESRVALV